MNHDSDTRGFHGLATGTLDELDQRIIECLQDDGRVSISEIARTIGLSHAGTSQRMQRLFSARIVSVGAVTNPTTHGYQRRAALLIRTGAQPRRVADEISEIPEAYYVLLVTGRLDLLVEFIARDDAHFEEIVGRIRAIDGVVEVEAVPALDLVKWEYRPEFPPR